MILPCIDFKLNFVCIDDECIGVACIISVKRTGCAMLSKKAYMMI
jgi:hypothetical protein